jgi:LPPG:FO 2-phospho-L-lactate transferase
MRITALAGGVGGARFLRGLLEAPPSVPAGAEPHEVTVIGNIGDDMTLHGLRICPDLDTVMYTLGGGIHEGQGWGRSDETFGVAAELKAYGVGPDWFTLGDKDIATHLVRTQMLTAGYPLSAVTEALCTRGELPVRLLPASDERVETHVVIDDPEGPRGRRAVHFQEYWVKLHAPDAHAVVSVGLEDAKPAPGVLEAIADADVIVLPPSNPVVSIGTILAIPGIRQALVDATAPVVGLSPIVGGGPVRGMADKVLAAVGVECTAAAVALHYGSEVLDGWLVDAAADADAVGAVEAAGIACRAVPLMMSSAEATVAMARAALELAAEIIARRDVENA